MAELDPIIQDLILNAAEYITDMSEVVHLMQDASDDSEKLDALLAVLEHSLRDAGTAAADMAAGFMAAGHGEDEMAHAAAEAEAGVSFLSQAIEALREYQTTGAVAADVHAEALRRDMLAAMEDAAMQNHLIDITNRLSRSQVINAATTATQGGMIARWWRQWSNVVHWVVMGSLEILATAVPALVALGAAVFAMEPTFAFIHDQLTALVTASGSLSNALKNIGGPLSGLAGTIGKVQSYARGDAFIILGSTMDILARKTGLFSTMAQKASDVLANFATKVVADLNGPAGNAIQGFFTSGVKYMVQWGQFLGNLGHTFVNVAAAMFGVSQVLLDVLVGISRVFVTITSNPVGAWFIGLAAAISAAARYGKLLINVWKFLAGTAVVQGIKTIVSEMATAVAMTGSWTAALTVLKGEMMTALAPILSAGGFAVLGAITAGLTLWWLASQKVNDSTTSLIQKVQSMPPTVENLSSGITTLSHALSGANAVQNQLNHTMGPSWKGAVGVHAGEVYKAKADVGQLTTALNQQIGKLVQLQAGLASVGSTNGQVANSMLALGIQTDLQDSKVQQLTQAWDQYMGLVTGGTSTLGGFSEALKNIGKVTVTGTNALKGYNAAAGLTTGQVAKQLQNFGQIGAQVWQQFDNTLTGSAQPLADWMREAQQAGAITGPQFTKSILDMASTMTKFAANSKPAQAELVAFAQQAGLPIHNYHELIQAIKNNGANWKDLKGQVTDATKAMANMNQIAKNLSATLTNQETQAIASAALKASGFTTDINNMLKAQQNNGTYGGKTTQQWADLASRAMHQAGSAAQNAARQIQGVKSAEDSLYNKNITIGVHTLYTTSATNPGGNAPAPHVGPSGGPSSGSGGQTNVHVHGSIMTEQSVGRMVQSVLNKKTIRNGSTQLYVSGRKH